MISVIIPTYKEEDYLDLCISSAVKNQNGDNQIIVIFDGSESKNANSKVIEKYSGGSVIMAAYHENSGMCRALNVGAFMASSDKLMIVNDDHVFPSGWDTEAESSFDETSIVTFNTIERSKSIYGCFEIENFGDSPSSFDMESFLDFKCSDHEQRENYANLPFLISQKRWHMLGGWDDRYPNGMVADFDFFFRAKLAGMNLKQVYSKCFYHFGSTSVNDDNMKKNGKMTRTESEIFGKSVFFRKFGNIRIDNQNILT